MERSAVKRRSARGLARCRRTTYTTGEVAHFCQVVPRTVSKWFDSGKLKGYRIPGSQDRRIPRDHLIRFLRDNGMPLDLLEQIGIGVLLVGLPEHAASSLTEALAQGENGLRIDRTSSLFEAGMVLGSQATTDVVVIDFAVGRSEALALAGRMRASEEHEECLIVGLLNEDEPAEAARPGFDVCLSKPIDVERLTCVLRDELDLNG